MPTANVGAILVANSTVWQNERYEFTGVIAPGDLVAPGQLYLGGTAGISSVNGTYVGWFLTWDGMGIIGNAYVYTEVTAYNGATKVATVNWDASTQSPPNGREWYLFREYPILRFAYWKRNGVAIPDANGLTYTATNADIGSDITYEETSGFIPRTTSGFVRVDPTVTGTATSAPITITGTPNNIVDSAADFTWLGSFKGPALGNDTGRVLTVIPASVSASGSPTLLVTNNYVLSTNATEIGIPALSTGALGSLNVATMLRPSGTTANTLEGQGGPSSGLTSGTEFRQNGACHIPGTTNMLVNNVGMYTPQDRALVWRRPVNLTTTGLIEGPFVVTDTTVGQYNSRWTGGNISKIPAAWQTALGGDMFLSAGSLSVAGSNSNGPSMMVINSANIDASAARINAGNARGGSTNTIQLALAANATDGYYVNDNIYIPTVEAGYIYRITAYVGATRTATLATGYPEAPLSRAPLTSDTYRIYPNIPGRQLVGYQSGSPLASKNSRLEAPVWEQVNTWINSAVFIPGTDCVVFIGNYSPSLADYSVRAAQGYPGQNNQNRVYLPYGFSPDSDGPGPKLTGFYPADNKQYIKFYVYKASELAAVASGAVGYNSLLPRAMFTFPLPYFDLANQGLSAAFDDINNRLYIWQQANTGGLIHQSVINVYSCSKFV